MQQAKLPISVVIISLNEERNIERAISSVALWVDDIVVYDSGSVDRTVDIATKLGARVVAGKWMGFGPTKRKATDLAKYNWILSIDSDEEVSLDLANEIKSKFGSLQSDTGYKFPRISFYLNTWIRHGGWYPDYQLRLFNREFSNWNEAKVHEKVEVTKQDSFVNNLNHYVFKDIEHQVSTNNRYSSLQAEDMQLKNIKFSWFHFYTKPAVKFVECYFLKLGLLDGWAGYVIARSAAYSVFLKWAKLRERELNL